MKLVLVAVFCVMGFLVAGQQADLKVYDQLTGSADKFFLKGDFAKAVDQYTQAFAANKGMGKVVHRYKAASCYAELNKPDSAFIQLDKITLYGGFDSLDLLTNDFHFRSLFDDPRWIKVVNATKKNMQQRP